MPLSDSRVLALSQNSMLPLPICHCFMFLPIQRRGIMLKCWGGIMDEYLQFPFQSPLLLGQASGSFYLYLSQLLLMLSLPLLHHLLLLPSNHLQPLCFILCSLCSQTCFWERRKWQTSLGLTAPSFCLPLLFAIAAAAKRKFPRAIFPSQLTVHTLLS